MHKRRSIYEHSSTGGERILKEVCHFFSTDLVGTTTVLLEKIRGRLVRQRQDTVERVNSFSDFTYFLQ